MKIKPQQPYGCEDFIKTSNAAIRFLFNYSAGLDAGGDEAVAAFNELVEAGGVVVALPVVHDEGRDAVEGELGNQPDELRTNHRESGGGVVDGVEALDAEGRRENP